MMNVTNFKFWTNRNKNNVAQAQSATSRAGLATVASVKGYSRSRYQTQPAFYLFIVFVLWVELLAGMFPTANAWAGYVSDNNATSATANNNSSSSAGAPVTPNDNQGQEQEVANQISRPGNGNGNGNKDKGKAEDAFAKLPLHIEANSANGRAGAVNSKVKYLARGRGYTIFFTPDEVVLDLPLPSTLREADEELCVTSPSPSPSSSPSPQQPQQPAKKLSDKECADRLANKHLPKSAKSGGGGGGAGNARRAALSVGLEGATKNKNPKIETGQPLGGKVNYLTGAKSADWQTGIETFGRLTYKEVYFGIDQVYYGKNGQLEYDFVVAPGADPNQIVIKFEGADEVELNAATGELEILIGKDKPNKSPTTDKDGKTQKSELTVIQKAPVIYQEGADGKRQSVTGSYVKKGPKSFGFTLGSYDRTRPLVIDPVLAYSTYLGGDEAEDITTAVAMDPAGNIYLTGYTAGFDFPVTAGVYNGNYSGGLDAFVTKLGANGNLLYSTYLAGVANDVANAIAVDAAGQVYVTGYTDSGNFPVTAGSYQPNWSGGEDVFVTKLNPSASGLIYSTFLGSAWSDLGQGIGVDGSGNIYVTGLTNNSGFPLLGAYQTATRGGYDGFITKLNPVATGAAALLYSTLYGSTGNDVVGGLVLDNSNRVYITGYTDSPNLTTTTGVAHKGFADIFVARFNPSATGAASFQYATYLGSNNHDNPGGIALDSTGGANSIVYVTGRAIGGDFPTTPNAYQTSGSFDMVAVKLNTGITNSVSLSYSTYLNGAGGDSAQAIKVDASGNMYLAGYAGGGFTTTSGAYRTTFSGGAVDGVLVKLNPNASGASSLLYSTYLGGGKDDLARGLVVTGTQVYVVGYTYSSDFPVTTDAYQSTSRGGSDVFVSRLDTAISGTNALLYSTYLGSQGDDDGGDIAVDSAGNAYVVGITSSIDLPGTTGYYQATNGGGTDVFVAKVAPDGNSLVYATYVGGSKLDYGTAIAVDNAGNAYFTGYTLGSYPTTAGAYQTGFNGIMDAFVTKLNPTGTALVYSTLIGGSGQDKAFGIAVDGSGQAHIAGHTRVNFPTTANAWKTTNSGEFDAVAAKLNATGTGLLYSTYLGGSSTDAGSGIALDSAGNMYVIGNTYSTNYPLSSSPAAYQNTLRNPGTPTGDIFLTKLNPAAISGSNSLVYSTYLGGNDFDVAYGIAVDSAQNAYLTGTTSSNDFPTTSNGLQKVYGGGNDSFLTKINTTQGGSAGLAYSTYIGGNGGDVARGITLDTANRVYFVGQTASANFPQITPNGFQTVYGGNTDGFLVVLTTTAIVSGQNSLVYGSYLGGSQWDSARDVALDASGNAYLFGATESSDFPIALNNLQAVKAGRRDTFVTKFGFTGLEFEVQPSSTLVGQAISPAVKVRVVDIANNVVSGYTQPISVTIVPNTGASDAILGGTTSVNAVGGVATFSNLSLDRVASGYQLRAASGSLLLPVSSQPFDVSANISTPVLTILEGTPQSVVTNTAFPKQFKVRVTQNGAPLAGKTVTFTAPANGASGTFAGTGGSRTFIGTTNASGEVTAPVFTANGTVGSYYVTAQAQDAANSVSFQLTNKGANSNPAYKLTLEPKLVGPNPLSTTQVLTATLTQHDVQPVANQTITFTIASATATAPQLIKTAQTNNNGLAVITYTRTITDTDDTITAYAVLNGTRVDSSVSQIYWMTPLNPASLSPIYTRIFNYARVQNITVTMQPIFTTTVSTLIFNPVADNAQGLFALGQESGTSQFTGPFTNVSLDVNGNYNGKIPLQGNGVSIGRYLYQTEPSFGYSGSYVGNVVIRAAGVVTFTGVSYDQFVLGIGPNVNNAQPVGNLTGCQVPDDLRQRRTPFLNAPYMGCEQQYSADNSETRDPTIGDDDAAVVREIGVNFPEPGIYPIELLHTEYGNNNDGFYGNPHQTLSIILTGGEKLGPGASLTMNVLPGSGTSVTTGQNVTVTVVAKNIRGEFANNQRVGLVIEGANPQYLVQTTSNDNTGRVTFVYSGTNPGIDTIRATAWIKGLPANSVPATQEWVAPSTPPPPDTIRPDVGCSISYNWVSVPGMRAAVSSRLQAKVAPNIALPVGTLVQVYPANSPFYSSMVTVTQLSAALAASGSAQDIPGAIIDSTKLSNGSYILRLAHTDGQGNCQSNLSIFNVVGENKPGRIAFDVTDFTVPIAGLPIVLGRTYDSLDRMKRGDFGWGWNLSISSPKIEVSPAKDVTLTLLDGRRVTFAFAPQSGGWLPLVRVAYSPEPGVYGTLEVPGSDDCQVLWATSARYTCGSGREFDPDSYQYRDPYGRIYIISRLNPDGSRRADNQFKQTNLIDLNGNQLRFVDDGIKAVAPDGSTSSAITITRETDPNPIKYGRIKEIRDASGALYEYGYNNEGGLTSVKYPGITTPTTYTYHIANDTDKKDFAHLFKEAFDARGKSVAKTEYFGTTPDVDVAKRGRLQKVTDAEGKDFTYDYAFNLDGTTTTSMTNPDNGGIVTTKVNAYGKVVSQIDPLTNETKFSYDAFNNKQTEENAELETTTFTYDPRGHQTGVKNHLNQLRTTGYNYYGGPALMTNEELEETRVEYDENFMPKLVKDNTNALMGGYDFDERGSVRARYDGNGRKTEFGYDRFGNKTSETDPTGASTTYEYDTMGRVTLMTDTLGVKTRYQYDLLGRVLNTTYALGTPRETKMGFEYDPNGNKTAEIDPANRRTVHAYDASNRLVRTTYPDNTAMGYEYDWRGNKTAEVYSTSTGTLYRRTEYKYDLAGRLVQTVYAPGTPDAASVRRTYDKVGRLLSETNPYPGAAASPPNGTGVTSYEYDDAGRLRFVTNPEGEITRYDYDDAGRKTEQHEGIVGNKTNPALMVTKYGYDVRGRLKLVTYHDATRTTQYEYDNAGNQKAVTDAGGLKTEYGYDGLNRLLSVKNPAQETVSYRYDKLGRLDAIIDAKFNETSFRYDELGRLKRKNWADGSSYEEFEYDAVGNRTAHRLADGNVNRYSYDVLNRLNGVRLFNESITTTIGYTPNGLRSSVVDGRGTTSYGYDNRDRLTLLTQPVKDTTASATYNQSVEYAYDPAGNRTSITTRNSSGVSQSSVSYSYDSAYRLKTATESGQGATTYNYNPLGLRTEQLLPNGRAVRYSYATSTPDRLEVVKHQLASDPVVATPLLSYSYSFNTAAAAGKAGLRTGLTETKNGTTTASYLWEYDSAYRLKKEKKTVGANPLVETGYDYDAAGNRTRTTLGGATTATYEYDKLDRLLLLKTATGAISEEYGYNPRGNLAQVKIGGTVARTFQWDGADRMIGATAGGTTLGMQYDVDGRRVQLSASGVITNYLWDITSRYGDVLLETGTNGAFKTSYVLGSGELISQKRGANPREYYLLDGQGSVRGLTDGTGTLTQEYAYDTFGKLTSGDASKSAYLYTGQQYDAATELYSLRARYYSPQQGRFLSMDKWPVNYQNPMELNRYGYTANNPINYADPSGYVTLKEYAITQVKTLYSFKSSSLALLGQLTLWLVVTTVWGTQISAILSTAERVECSSSVVGTSRSDCTYYLSTDSTKALIKSINDLADFLSNLDTPLLITGFLLAFIPYAAVAATLVGLVGYGAGNDVARMKDIVINLTTIVAWEQGKGRAWVRVPQNNVYHSSGMTCGKW
jgi:RHS repeat-associated protein